MKHLKHGVALLVVLIALFVASLGASFSDFTANSSGISIDSTYRVTKDGDYLIGASGLHW